VGAVNSDSAGETPGGGSDFSLEGYTRVSPPQLKWPRSHYETHDVPFFKRGEKPAELIRGCVRIRGYLLACFAMGAHYKIWDKHQFAKRSGYKVEYVEQLMRAYRKVCTEFTITEIRYKRSPRLKVSLAGAGPGAGGAGSLREVRARLIGYIKASVQKYGFARVDKGFLDHFVRTTGMPTEVVAGVWRRLRSVPGMRGRWRGTGANLKFVVSLQESFPLHGSPTGRRDTKTVATPSPSGEKSNARSAPGPTSASWRCPPTAMADGPSPLPPPYGFPTGNPSGAPPDHNHETTSEPEWRGDPLAAPFAIDGRWIAGRKIVRLACWLAVEPMQAVHARHDRVRWRFAHARNFAARALRLGHRAAAVLAAWEAGVGRSHEDVLDAGLRGTARRGEHTRESHPREPSAAVVYAWAVLREDARSPADRWREIFAGERQAPVARVRIKRRMTEQKITSAAFPEQISDEIKLSPRDRAKFAELKDAIDLRDDQRPPSLPSGMTVAALAAHLRTRDMTLAQFNCLPWASKKRVLQAVAAKIQPETDSKYSI